MKSTGKSFLIFLLVLFSYSAMAGTYISAGAGSSNQRLAVGYDAIIGDTAIVGSELSSSTDAPEGVIYLGMNTGDYKFIIGVGQTAGKPLEQNGMGFLETGYKDLRLRSSVYCATAAVINSVNTCTSYSTSAMVTYRLRF